VAICPNGHQNAESLKFCGECGTAIAAPPSICPNGHDNAEGQRFCKDTALWSS
jgi:hypothetical protein